MWLSLTLFAIFQSNPSDKADFGGLELIFQQCPNLQHLNISGEHQHFYDKSHKLLSRFKGRLTFGSEYSDHVHPAHSYIGLNRHDCPKSYFENCVSYLNMCFDSKMCTCVNECVYVLYIKKYPETIFFCQIQSDSDKTRNCLSKGGLMHHVADLHRQLNGSIYLPKIEHENF